MPSGRDPFLTDGILAGTEYDAEAVTDWQSLRDLERDILRKRMTESEAREAFREYFENLITDMRYYDSEKAE